MGFGGSGGSEMVMGEWLVAHQCMLGQWIVGGISFQKIFGLCDLKGRIVEIREDNNRKKTFSFGHCPKHLNP